MISVGSFGSFKDWPDSNIFRHLSIKCLLSKITNTTTLSCFIRMVFSFLDVFNHATFWFVTSSLLRFQLFNFFEVVFVNFFIFFEYLLQFWFVIKTILQIKPTLLANQSVFSLRCCWSVRFRIHVLDFDVQFYCLSDPDQKLRSSKQGC